MPPLFRHEQMIVFYYGKELLPSAVTVTSDLLQRQTSRRLSGELLLREWTTCSPHSLYAELLVVSRRRFVVIFTCSTSFSPTQHR